ncbi:hypothetical protein D9V37_12930 [Nocardioides mangrovicus]|uniref:Uncharacterized protein n=1 Tax=Nocardioides mangrovicus TaxID=2478913 RepID=A0A3L8P0D0_9ACTN|nr:hypothetical protein D9V37_12930 [Nocardioides mangrovicus]
MSLILVPCLATGCGRAGVAKDLDPGSGRRAVVASLDQRLCGGRMRVIEDSRPYWVGLCQNRSAFEDRVVFLAFDSRADRDHYLAQLESCFEEGSYTEGPRWFAMSVTRADTATLRRDGARAVRCG